MGGTFPGALTASFAGRYCPQAAQAVLRWRSGGRELGHLHGDHAAHFSFPKDVWAELTERGRIVPHQVFPNAQGPAARSIEDEHDVRDVIALLRLNYDWALARHGPPAETAARASP